MGLALKGLSGSLINANMRHSTLIYLALKNVACKLLSANLYSHIKMKLNCVKTCKNEAKLCKGGEKNVY